MLKKTKVYSIVIFRKTRSGNSIIYLNLVTTTGFSPKMAEKMTSPVTNDVTTGSDNLAPRFGLKMAASMGTNVDSENDGTDLNSADLGTKE